MMQIALFMFLCVPLSVFAQKGDFHSQEEIEKVLVQLDSAIAHKQEYHTMRQVQIDSMRKVVYNCDSDQYVQKCQELFTMLSDYDGKRSLEALRLIEATDTYATDKDLQAWVALKKVDIYGTIGLYHKAKTLLSSLSPRHLSEDRRLQYYHAYRSFYQRVADYVSDYDIAEEEESKLVIYYDSILALHPVGVGRDIAIANRDLYVGNYEHGIKVAVRDLNIAEGKEYLYLCSTLAHLYAGLGNQENYVYYLAISSLTDIKNGTTEYQALPFLVQALYESGDVDRAYVYLMCVMEDANIFPTRNLAVKISNYFPYVSHAYNKNISFLLRSEKDKRNSLAVTYALFALTICVVFYMGWKYNLTKEQEKRTDELQKALEKAKVADRIKTVFIQNMRHEIRTPLNTIVGFAQLMSNDLSLEERELYNGYIQESNDQLLGILDTIIDLSNMEVGSFNFHFEKTDINELCKEKLENCRKHLAGGVELVYQPNYIDSNLYCDPTRLGQVLDNLLSNACKYTSSGTILLEVSPSEDNSTLQFTVADTGIGVAPDKANIIFDRFEKIDPYNPGLGLGLYISGLIIRALGGELYLDKQYVGGAKFVFTVPMRNTTSIPTPTSESESQADKNLHIGEVSA